MDCCTDLGQEQFSNNAQWLPYFMKKSHTLCNKNSEELIKEKLLIVLESKLEDDMWKAEKKRPARLI